MSPQRLGSGRREADWSSVIVSQQGKLMILRFALRCRCYVFFHIMPSKPQEKVSEADRMCQRDIKTKLMVAR